MLILQQCFPHIALKNTYAIICTDVAKEYRDVLSTINSFRLEHVLKFHKKHSFMMQDLAVVLYRCRSLDLMRVLYERFMIKLKLRCEHIV